MKNITNMKNRNHGTDAIEVLQATLAKHNNYEKIDP